MKTLRSKNKMIALLTIAAIMLGNLGLFSLAETGAGGGELPDKQIHLHFNGSNAVNNYVPTNVVSADWSKSLEDHYTCAVNIDKTGASKDGNGFRIGDRDSGTGNDRHINAVVYYYLYLDLKSLPNTSKATGIGTDELAGAYNGIYLRNYFTGINQSNCADYGLSWDGTNNRVRDLGNQNTVNTGYCVLDFFPYLTPNSMDAIGGGWNDNQNAGFFRYKNDMNNPVDSNFDLDNNLYYIGAANRRYDDAKRTIFHATNKRSTVGLTKFDISDLNDNCKNQLEIYFAVWDQITAGKLEIGSLWLSNDSAFTPPEYTTYRVNEPYITTGSPAVQDGTITASESFSISGDNAVKTASGLVVKPFNLSYYKYMFINFNKINDFKNIVLKNINGRNMLTIGDSNSKPIDFVGSDSGVLQIDLSKYRFDFFGGVQSDTMNYARVDNTALSSIDFDLTGATGELEIEGIYFSNEESPEVLSSAGLNIASAQKEFEAGESFTAGGKIEITNPAKTFISPIIPYPRKMSSKATYQISDESPVVTNEPHLFPLGMTTAEIGQGVYNPTGPTGTVKIKSLIVSDSGDRNAIETDPITIMSKYTDSQYVKLFGHDRKWFNMDVEPAANYNPYTDMRRCASVVSATTENIDITADMCIAYVKGGDPTDDAIDLTEPLEIGEYTVEVAYENLSYTYDIEVIAEDNESSNESSDSSESSSSDSSSDSSDSTSSDSSSSETGSGTIITNSDIDKTAEVNIRGEVGTDWIVVIPVGSADIDLYDTDNEQLIGQLGVTSARLEIGKKLVVTADSDEWKLSGISEGNTTTKFGYSLTQAGNTWEFTQVSNPLIDVEIKLSEGANGDTPPDIYKDIITFTVDYVSQ